jgi:hypothetical protein
MLTRGLKDYLEEEEQWVNTVYILILAKGHKTNR